MASLAISSKLYDALHAATYKSVAPLDFNGLRVLAKIVDVYDGDTCTAAFWFSGSLVRTPLRMYGFDSPELKSSSAHKVTPAEKKLALACRDALAAVVLNRVVAVELGPSDHYGRPLARVFADVPSKDLDRLAQLVADTGGGPPGAGSVARAVKWLRKKWDSKTEVAYTVEQRRQALEAAALEAAARDLPRESDLTGGRLERKLVNVNTWMLAATCSEPFGEDMLSIRSGAPGAPLTENEYRALKGASRESTFEFELVGRTLAKVVKVYDGDTCTVAIPFGARLARVNVRTAHYDSPEMRGKKDRPLKPGEKEQAILCRDVLRRLILNRIVVVDFLANPGHHNYGRALGEIYAKRARDAEGARGGAPLLGGAGDSVPAELAATIPPVADFEPADVAGIRSATIVGGAAVGNIIDISAWMLAHTPSVPYELA